MRLKYAKVDLEPKKKRNRVTFSEVEKIFELYCDDHAVMEISELLGITTTTIHKYIDYGDPKRDIEPLRLRRVRVFKRAAELKDSSLAERIAENIEVAVRVFGDSGRRIAERVAARRMLDDCDGVLTDDEVDNATKIAYEPTTDDYVKFHKVCSDWVGILSLPTKDAVSALPIHLNVNQMQAQGSTNEQVVEDNSMTKIARDGVDAVYKHLEGMASASVEDYNRIAAVTAEVSENVELLEE
jgi:predicted transcriptional regulator